MIDLQPTVCNLCGGHVILTSNSVIYGREYGSGKCYFCNSCKAYVGTHIPRPEEAFGILSNAEMREMKTRCHEIFDQFWKNAGSGKKRHQKRQDAYKRLAKDMEIPITECHFGYFGIGQLRKAYEIVSGWVYEFERCEKPEL